MDERSYRSRDGERVIGLICGLSAPAVIWLAACSLRFLVVVPLLPQPWIVYFLCGAFALALFSLIGMVGIVFPAFRRWFFGAMPFGLLLLIAYFVHLADGSGKLAL